MKRLIAFTFIMLSARFLIFAYTQDNIFRQIEALYDSCDRPDVPGGFAAAVIKDENVVFKKAYGYADYENNVPFSFATVVDYASVAKQFTGFAIAQLIKEGKLRLDDDIRIYLPEIPDFGCRITIDHLLHHTSGIRDWFGLVKISGRYENDVITGDFLRNLMKNQKELNFKPGERFQYSNMGYFLLANIVSRVSGRSFREWTQENIFKPLNMNNTHFSDDYREIIMNRAHNYRQDDKGNYLNSPSHYEACGSSSLFSTIDDMIKWVQNFERKTLGGAEVWDMMLKRGVLNNGGKVNYGFGIDLNDRYGMHGLGHEGSFAGALCQITYFTDLKLGTILVTNRDPSGVYADESVLNLFLNRKKEDTGDKIKEALDRKEVKINPNILQDYTGVYFFREWAITIENVDNNLVVHMPWGEQYKIYPESDNKFFHKNVNVQFTFLRDAQGMVDRMIYHFKGKANPPFRKLETDASRCEDIGDLCGEYMSNELLTTYTIKIQNNRVVVTHMQNENVSLAQIDKDNYLGNQWWFDKLKVVRDANGGISGFKLTGDSDNIQNLLFIKQGK